MTDQQCGLPPLEGLSPLALTALHEWVVGWGKAAVDPVSDAWAVTVLAAILREHGRRTATDPWVPDHMPVTVADLTDAELGHLDGRAVILGRSNREGLAEWCALLRLRIRAVQDRRRAEHLDEVAQLQAHIDTLRAKNPHGTGDADLRGLPPWSVASVQPPDDTTNEAP